ncbi:fanconi-associated nuclease 1 [Brachionus plicatilis]|uniref:Fanconi-associated nuclease n=1 Tax=Brachionus plicatilis TaxID=10195 RepID=A0A3M7PEG7_BRAPC|nr:fanconi-associated nuclease 1 [Brachionus plicatilis]
MPIKRSSSGKLSRKSSSNNLEVSETEKNSLLNMFKKIESDSILKECDLCHKKLKSSMLNKHQKFECTNNIKTESLNNEEIIIIDDDEPTNKPAKCEKIDHDDMSEINSSPKRIKLEQDSVFSEKNSDTNEDKDLSEDLQNNEPFDFYLKNFTNAIDSVLKEEQFSHLFDDQDLKIIEKFNFLGNSAKMLYVRLFQRKFKWHSIENINYERISKDSSPYLDELKRNEFIIDETSIQTYEEVIYLFKIPQLKELIRICHISAASQSNKTEMIRTILQHFRTQKSVKSHFFKKSLDDQAKSSSTPNYMLQCKSILGKCFKLDKNVRGIFVRALILYSLSSSYQSDPNNAGQQQLYYFIFLFYYIFY